jgi:hypothetical protein
MKVHLSSGIMVLNSWLDAVLANEIDVVPRENRLVFERNVLVSEGKSGVWNGLFIPRFCKRSFPY